MEPHRVGRRLAPYDGPRSERVEAVLEATRAVLDRPALNIFTTLAHHPRALRHATALGGTFLVTGNLPARIREIVILRVAGNTRCEYEYAQHDVIGRQSGLSADECRALLATDPGVGFASEERDVIAMTDELCADDVVGDPTWERLAERWEPRELVELLLLAGYYRMLAGFLNTTGVELDAGLAGWPEDERGSDGR